MHLNLQPTPTVPSKTIFLPRGRVWPYTDPTRFITVGKLKRQPSGRIAVLAANSTKWQRWAIVFDRDLQSKTQFLIVSYPVPKYIVKVVSTKKSSYRLALERIPKKRGMFVVLLSTTQEAATSSPVKVATEIPDSVDSTSNMLQPALP